MRLLILMALASIKLKSWNFLIAHHNSNIQLLQIEINVTVSHYMIQILIKFNHLKLLQSNERNKKKITCKAKRERVSVFTSKVNGENQRRQRMACRKCHRAPLLHLEFVQECETQRIRLLQRQIQC